MLDSTLEAYTQYGKDLEILYRERHFMISQQLPHLSGCGLQKTIEGIDGDLANIMGEIAECKDAIKLIKQGNDPEELRRKFDVTWSLSACKEDIIVQFKHVILERKSAAKLIRREKAVYQREKVLRKLAAAQLAFARIKRKDLEKQCLEVFGEMRVHLEQVDQLCSAYQSNSCEIGLLQAKVQKLSFARENLNSLPSIQPGMIEANKKFLEELRNYA